jgi:hypothetical protein
MSFRFDATMKDLGRDNPVDFLITFYRPPTGVVALLNPDLSTVTTAADFVLGLGDPLIEVVHIDFQTGPSAWKHASTLVYNALLHCNHHVPVHSIVILLRSEAAHTNLNGTVNYASRPEHGSMNFRYEVVRLWEWPAEPPRRSARHSRPRCAWCITARSLNPGRAGRSRATIGRADRA